MKTQTTKGTTKPAQADAKRPMNGRSAPKLPHERDQSTHINHPEQEAPAKARVVKQAQVDVNRGLLDTDKGPELEHLAKQNFTKQ